MKRKRLRKVYDKATHKTIVDGLVLTIHYGSGTGMSVIEEILKVNWGVDGVNINNKMVQDGYALYYK